MHMQLLFFFFERKLEKRNFNCVPFPLTPKFQLSTTCTWYDLPLLALWDELYTGDVTRLWQVEHEQVCCGGLSHVLSETPTSETKTRDCKTLFN